MIPSSLLFVVLAVEPVADLTGPAVTEPPEDAQMGDGLRVSEPQDDLQPRAVTCADGTTLKGVDISKWQDDVNWTSIANSGVKFAFVRVSDGLNSKDAKFDRNWTQARAAGIYTGAYQFFRPNQSVLGQADYLLEKMGCNLAAKTCPWSDMDLPPVLDVEYRPSGWTQTQMRNAIRTWIDRVEQFGVEPIIYSGRYFWQDYVASTEWNDHPLWIAHYTNACPNIPSQWADWDFWQYTDKGSQAGVNGNTDMNQFNGTLDMLKALRPSGGGGGETPPASCGRLAADAPTVIDNTDDCFALGGPNQYWRSESAGYDGDMNWTRSTSGTEYNFGTWTLDFDEGGKYLLQVYVDENHTEASVAKYVVTHANGTSTVTVNQTKGGWIELGTFEFDEGETGHKVRLSDKTGQAGKKLAFDALRVVPEGVDPGDDCGEPTTPRQDGGTGIPGWNDRGEEALGCRIGGSGSHGWWLMALGLVGLVRRRRAA